MKKLLKILVITSLSAIVAVLLFAAVACNNKEQEHVHVDYVSQLQLDFTTDTKKQEVTVRLFIDGDTTHFDPVEGSKLTPGNTGDFKDTQGYIKARYLAINTPESTGQIEEWGKKASKFTRSKLESAESIIVESDVNYWDIDSTGERYLLWVWYKPADSTEYRNLNVEILQEGLAFASRTADGIYGDIAQKALDQAQIEKLNIYSGEKDPDFYYGDMKYVSLKELRCFPEEYDGIKISVQGTVIGRYDNSAYIEAFDADTGLYFGMPVYYGFGAGNLLNVLSIGNEVEVVGTFSVSDTFGHQISGLTPIDGFNKNDPDVCKILKQNVQPAFTKIEDPSQINSTTTVEIVTDREDENGELIKVKMLYSDAITSTSVTCENLYVKSAYTTNNGGDSDGAMTLYCETADHKEVQIRTDVLKLADGTTLVTQDEFVGKNITVKGIVEKYTNNGKTTYQVKCYRYDYITVLDA